MIGTVGQRFGSLVLLSRADGRRWSCRCDCGRVETYRWAALRSEGTSAVRRCTMCDSQCCQTCGAVMPRGKARYCSQACRKRALGLRQAEYYRRQIQSPVFRAQRQRQIHARRKNLTDEQRERRRAQNRSWLTRLSPEQMDAIRHYKRLWYSVNAGRISTKRRLARLTMSPEQRADLSSYMRSWYREKLERLKQDPQAFDAYRRRRRLMHSEWKTSIALDMMGADVSRLTTIFDE